MKRRKPSVEQIQKMISQGRASEIDGLWWIASSDTQTYCRPTCVSKTPDAPRASVQTLEHTCESALESARENTCESAHKNILILRSAAECEAAGFQACPLCHPEGAPHMPLTGIDTVGTYASLIDEYALSPACLTKVEAMTGISPAFVEKDFHKVFGVTPEEYLATARNHVKELARNPSAIALSYRKPYDFQQILDFLKFRAIGGIEKVRDGRWARTLTIEGARGWVEVRNDEEQSCIILSLSDNLVPFADQIIAKTRRLFDVDCDPKAIKRALAPFRKQVARKYHRDGIRLPCSFEPFEMAVRAIIGQQITVKAANTLATRLATTFGDPLECPLVGLTHTFPSPELFLREDAVDVMGSIGIIGNRGRAIQALAKAIVDGDLRLGVGADVDTNYARLLELPGIGPWTAQYMLMRAFHYTDGFPATDYGVKISFPHLKPKEIEALSHDWKPYRAYAVMSLWSAPHGL